MSHGKMPDSTPWTNPAQSLLTKTEQIDTNIQIVQPIIVYIYTGWWYTYPSEKMMEFVSWDVDIPNIWKN